MAYEINPIEAYGIFSLAAAASTTIKVGDLVGLNGSGLAVLADASAAGSEIWCFGIALNNVETDSSAAAKQGKSSVVNIARAAVIQDLDTAAFTAEAIQYLSGTAGSMTATRPTGANDFIQVVGQAISANMALFHGGAIREKYINVHLLASQGTAAMSHNGDYVGVGLLAVNDACGGTFECPANTLPSSGIVMASLWWTDHASSPALDSSDTYTIDVSAAIDDETTTAVTDGITAASLAVADNDLNKADVSAAFDAAGIIQPGNVVTIDVDKAAEGTAGDDPLMLCITIVLKVVDPI